MTPKLFVIDSANLETTNVSVEAILSRLNLSDYQLFIGRNLNLNKDIPCFNSILDWTLFLARKLKLLKNDRVLYMTEEESFQTIALILRKMYKDETGDDDFPLSEVLEVYRKLAKEDTLEEFAENDSFVNKTKQKYQKHLKSSQVIDIHGLTKIVKNQNLQLEKSPILMVCDRTMKGPLKNLMEILFQNYEKFQIQAELSLDASLNGQENFEISTEPWNFDDFIPLPNSEISCEEKGVEISNSEIYCQSLILSFLKLLINSREELSLAKVIGPESVLDHKIFTVIRKEAEKTKMPLYQTVVSYIQKLKLGGKSYVPSSDHPFMPFNKDLTEFTNLMSKLYSKLEDEIDSENAFKKVMTCLKSHISKSSTTLKLSSVEKVIEKMLDQFSICQKRFQTYEILKNDEGKEDLANNTGSKKIVVAIDKKNLQEFQYVVDYFVTNQIMTKSVHELLGKIQPSSKDDNKTPIVVPNAMNMYETPLTPETPKNSSNKINSNNKSDLLTTKAGNETPQTSKLGKPKFDAALAWAMESSPLVLKSSERNIKTSGVTLAVLSEANNLEASPKLSEIVRKGLQDAEDALNEARKAIRPKKSSKRTILGELKNVEKWEKMQEDKPEKLDKPSKKMKGEDLKGQENLPQKKEKSAAPPKKTSKKKQPTLLKGQTKMTAFLRM